MAQLDRGGFKAWLEARDEGEVYERLNPEQCPIARYLTETFPLSDGEAYHTLCTRTNVMSAGSDDGGGVIVHPWWAQMFIIMIDGMVDRSCATLNITNAEARDVLNNLGV